MGDAAGQVIAAIALVVVLSVVLHNRLRIVQPVERATHTLQQTKITNETNETND
jgi:regulator of protease activity HflC (stomatin/prohibitin superfamily)